MIENIEFDEELDTIPEVYKIIGIYATVRQVNAMEEDFKIFDEYLCVVSDYESKEIDLTPKRFEKCQAPLDVHTVFSSVFPKDVFCTLTPVIDLDLNNMLIGTYHDVLEFIYANFVHKGSLRSSFIDHVRNTLKVKDFAHLKTFFCEFIITDREIKIMRNSFNEANDYYKSLDSNLKKVKHLFCNFKTAIVGSYLKLIIGKDVRVNVEKAKVINLNTYDTKLNVEQHVITAAGKGKEKRSELLTDTEFNSLLKLSTRPSEKLNKEYKTLISEESIDDLFKIPDLEDSVDLKTTAEVAFEDLARKFPDQLGAKTKKLFLFNYKTNPELAVKNFNVSLNYGKYAASELKKDKFARVDPSEFYKQIETVPTDKINNASQLVDVSMNETRFENLMEIMPNNKLFMVALKEYRFTLKMRLELKPIYIGTVFTVVTNNQTEKVSLYDVVASLSEIESKKLLETSMILSYALCKHIHSNFHLDVTDDLWDIRALPTPDRIKVEPKYLVNFIGNIVRKVKVKTEKGDDLSDKVYSLVSALADRQFKGLTNISKNSWTKFTNCVNNFSSVKSKTIGSYFGK